MGKFGRVVLIMAILAVVVALPSSALARKQVYKARLTTDAEVHQVIGSNAAGNAWFYAFPDGMRFTVAVYGISGQATGAHIHAPAAPGSNAPVVLTLCGAPTPAAVTTCTFDNGNMFIEGVIGPSLLQAWGLTGAQLFSYFDNGLAYVNVHTALNPMGEVRGQVIGQ